jgi:hypothetical protein
VIESSRAGWTGHVAGIRQQINTFRVLVGKPEGKRSLGKRRLRWEDNIKMDIQEVGLGHGLDSSGS